MANNLVGYPEKVGLLLLQALANEQKGLSAAYRLLQNLPGPFPWMYFLEKLCLKVPVLPGSDGKMVLKSRLFMFSLQTQRNLFRLLNFMFHSLPPPGTQILAAAICEEPHITDAWLQRLTQQFLTAAQKHRPPQVTNCLDALCKHLWKPPSERCKLGWYTNGVSLRDTQNINMQDETQKEESKEECDEKDCEIKVSSEAQSPSSVQDDNMDVEEDTDGMPDLPPDIKAHAPKLKQFLYQNMENEVLDNDFLTEMNTIRELCSPVQLKALMCFVEVSQIPEKCLLQYCIHLDSLSPDLSYAEANSLSASLFVDRVLSLTTPASRTLTTALAMFCKKYAHPACSSLIGPVLDQAQPGSVHADFLCRMIIECLQPDQLRLCLNPILEASSSEVAITILHLLIEKKDKLSRSEFGPLLSYLCDSAEKFSTSVAFSKLLLLLLTKKANLIRTFHVGLLSTAVNSNNTFMKKSLQNALKKITKTV